MHWQELRDFPSDDTMHSQIYCLLSLFLIGIRLLHGRGWFVTLETTGEWKVNYLCFCAKMEFQRTYSYVHFWYFLIFLKLYKIQYFKQKGSFPYFFHFLSSYPLLVFDMLLLSPYVLSWFSFSFAAYLGNDSIFISIEPPILGCYHSSFNYFHVAFEMISKFSSLSITLQQTPVRPREPVSLETAGQKTCALKSYGRQCHVSEPKLSLQRWSQSRAGWQNVASPACPVLNICSLDICHSTVFSPIGMSWAYYVRNRWICLYLSTMSEFVE